LITKCFREAYSTSNLELSRLFRYSRRFDYAPFLIAGLHSTFSVLKTELFEHLFDRKFKKSDFDHEVFSRSILDIES